VSAVQAVVHVHVGSRGVKQWDERRLRTLQHAVAIVVVDVSHARNDGAPLRFDTFPEQRARQERKGSSSKRYNPLGLDELDL